MICAVLLEPSVPFLSACLSLFLSLSFVLERFFCSRTSKIALYYEIHGITIIVILLNQSPVGAVSWCVVSREGAS